MRRALALALAVALVRTVGGSVAAQPAPAPRCDACTRGDALIARFELEAMRPLAGRLAALALSEPVTEPQYEAIIALRAGTPALARVGALDDDQLVDVAAALCQRRDDACRPVILHALTCLADRCAVALAPDPAHADVLVRRDCWRGRRPHRGPPIGVALDWGNGYQRSGFPNDGRAWSLGVEGRYRLGRRLGVVARVDRAAGRDESTDADGDGHDDLFTGSITRFSALAGPSIVLATSRYERTTRFLRLDLLGGYLMTTSQPGEDGVAAGADLAYQLSAFRLGVRVVQGFGDANDAMIVLGHLGIAAGGAPPPPAQADCAPPEASRTRLALGFELPLGGYGIARDLGYLSTGLGLEAVAHLSRRFDAISHVDLLLYPGEERDHVIHQAVLGGLRYDHGPRRRRAKTNFYSTVMAGYTHGAGFTPSESGSGPVVDVSLAWGGQDNETAGYLRLHGRFGVGPDNTDYRAVFLAIGFELRFSGDVWEDRDRSW